MNRPISFIPRWKITRTRDKNWLVTRFGVARAVFTTWTDAYDYAARKAAQGEL